MTRTAEAAGGSGEGGVWGPGSRQPRVTDCAWPGGLGSFQGLSLAPLYSQVFHVPAGRPQSVQFPHRASPLTREWPQPWAGHFLPGQSHGLHPT